MQTFLPYPDYARSARVLDDRRLGKQRVEALQILEGLIGLHEGWSHHPALLMWSGHEYSLSIYGATCCLEFASRGHADSLLYDFQIWQSILPDSGPPAWMGGEIHASHRSNLLRKDSDHYGRFGWSEPNDLPYIWPGELNGPSTDS